MVAIPGYPMVMISQLVLPRIKLLPELLANQIAAGEVIERPASVVKELLENSIDAGATEIRLEIEGGGVSLIRVRDNGHGIHKDDLELALLSHATSKLGELADLYHITSLGFRGEALSSIAAVSQFQLTSRLQGAAQAWRIWKDPFSSANELQPATHPAGTTVEVKNLFYATPARRKFLKSVKTEFLHILEIVRRIALSRFDISIRLLHEEKLVLFCRSNPEHPDELVRSIMGTDFCGVARRLDYTAGNMRLWGWLGTADLSRSQMDRQYFYFNGRMIRDKHINHAIRLVYADSLPAGRYPTYLLHLEADPGAADVNVHPTKYEIRFQNARDVHDFIYSSLRSALEQSASPIPQQADVTGSSHRPEHFGGTHAFPVRGSVHEQRQSYNQMTTADDARLFNAESTELGQPLVQLYGRYLISKQENDYLLIDVHNARRLLIRTIMASASEANPAPARPLLVPVSMPVSTTEAEQVERHGQALRFCGVILERQGPQTIVIRAIPVSMPHVDLQCLVQDLLALLQSLRDRPFGHDQLIDVLAAHANDGATEGPDISEMSQVLRTLTAAGVGKNCQQPGIWRRIDAETLAQLLA